MSTPLPAYPDPQANRFVSVADVAVGSVVAARVGGCWRRCRVLATARKRVRLAFHVGKYGKVNRQWVHVARLRRDTPAGVYGVVPLSAPVFFTEPGK